MDDIDSIDTQDVINFFRRLEQEVTGNHLQDYVIAGAITLLGLAIVVGLRGFLRNRVAKWVSRRAGSHANDVLFARAVQALFSILMIVPFYAAFGFLHFSPEYTRAIRLVFLFLFTWRFMMFFSRFLIALLDSVLSRTESYMGVRAVAPIITFVVWAIGISFLLDNVGLKISSIMAGLGIVGIAVGLASQAILGDFFGYLVILLDRPFKIGDSVRAGSNSGTVERVGFKTTKLRAGTGELISVPNGDISKQALVNNAMTEERGRVFQFGVTYQTSLDKVKAIPGIVTEIVQSIPKTRLDHVNFVNFADSSLLFEVQFMVQTTSGNQVLAVQHAINMGLMERFEEEGIEFAYPTSTLYLASEKGLINQPSQEEGNQ